MVMGTQPLNLLFCENNQSIFSFFPKAIVLTYHGIVVLYTLRESLDLAEPNEATVERLRRSKVFTVGVRCRLVLAPSFFVWLDIEETRPKGNEARVL